MLEESGSRYSALLFLPHIQSGGRLDVILVKNRIGSSSSFTFTAKTSSESHRCRRPSGLARKRNGRGKNVCGGGVSGARSNQLAGRVGVSGSYPCGGSYNTQLV